MKDEPKLYTLRHSEQHQANKYIAERDRPNNCSVIKEMSRDSASTKIKLDYILIMHWDK